VEFFYTYVYLDPRKPGRFDYDEFHFDFEPFYVGKGKGNQWLLHLQAAKNKFYKGYRINKIRKIQSLDLEPKIIKYEENLTEQEAFSLEKKLIKAIGRFDLGQGPLTNLTDGGEGISNPSRETRQKIAEKKRGKSRGTKADTPWIARAAEKHKIRMTGDNNPSKLMEVRKKISKSHMGKTKENDPGKARAAEKMKIIMKGRTKETHPGVARMSVKMLGNKNGRGNKKNGVFISCS